MKIYKPFEEDVPAKGVAALGFFDGVHIGHQAILNKVKTEAAKLEATPLLLTLWPHPRIVLNKNTAELHLINTLEEKTSLFSQNGLEHFVVIPFTEELSNYSAEAFFKHFFVDWLKLSKLIVGYDHHIGKNGTGDFESMQRLGDKYGISVEKIDALTSDDISISSTKIRNLITNGDVATAHKYLGYRYFISGTVEYGNQLGRQIGFPTANIKVDNTNKLIPADGVYAVNVIIDGFTHKGMLNIGLRPTINNNLHKTIEVNIFDFNRTIYGCSISILFVERIRSEKKFESIESLKFQLELDKNIATKILNKID